MMVEKESGKVKETEFPSVWTEEPADEFGFKYYFYNNPCRSWR
jgi:hypothetical protein